MQKHKPECCICYERQYITYTNCKHCICVDCLMILRQLSCPICRRDLSKELPKNLLKFLKAKNNIKLEKRPMYLRLNDNQEFPPL